MTITEPNTAQSGAPLDLQVELTLRVAEYEQLKAEQRARIERRDHLVYATLTAIVAAVAAAAQVPLALLLLAPAVLILGWTHLINDQKISAAGQYLRGPLSRRLAELTGGDTVVLGWEFAHRADERREERKAIQLLVDLATFVAPAFLGMVGYVALGHPPLPVWGTVLVLLILAGLAGNLAAQQLAYADVDALAGGPRGMWRRARARLHSRASRTNRRLPSGRS
ncbi:hypothetical protein ACQEVZ_60650 [Dactylosporangium sp. CA-152071]|uniref:hypothetical protein n=1 Tax=Dactylosporangium sp. CA-152071 TaxID=3239933 RepID=UPI003D8C5320